MAIKITDDCINVDSDGIFTNTCDSNNIKQRWNLNTDEKLYLDN